MVPDRQKGWTDGRTDGRTTPKLYPSDFVGGIIKRQEERVTSSLIRVHSACLIASVIKLVWSAFEYICRLQQT